MAWGMIHLCQKLTSIAFSSELVKQSIQSSHYSLIMALKTLGMNLMMDDWPTQRLYGRDVSQGDCQLESWNEGFMEPDPFCSAGGQPLLQHSK